MTGYKRRKSVSKRVGLLDEARGLCVILMVVYHAFYDLVHLFGVNIPAFYSPILSVLQPFFAGMFIFISGIACRYSRNNLKRGVIALALGLVFTAFTWYFMPGQTIAFGILHFLGVCMILFTPFEKGLDSLPAFWGLLLCVALAVFFWGVPRGYLQVPGLWHFSLPRALYETSYLFPLGFAGSGFSSADYFPLLPWLFVFFAGSYAGVFFTGGDLPAFVYRSHSRPLAAVGRRALPVYVLHQPVIYGVLWAAFWCWEQLRLHFTS